MGSADEERSLLEPGLVHAESSGLYTGDGSVDFDGKPMKLNVLQEEVNPPSRTRLCAVMNPASSEARNSAACATSSTVAALPRNKLPVSPTSLLTCSGLVSFPRKIL
ncbi:hypothetical protein QQP08_007411 [Theobroma cacao]|nr:hypothetical protein QQP08_007411 [Theobroma cacao]